MIFTLPALFHVISLHFCVSYSSLCSYFISRCFESFLRHFAALLRFFSSLHSSFSRYLYDFFTSALAHPYSNHNLLCSTSFHCISTFFLFSVFLFHTIASLRFFLFSVFLFHITLIRIIITFTHLFELRHFIAFLRFFSSLRTIFTSFHCISVYSSLRSYICTRCFTAFLRFLFLPFFCFTSFHCNSSFFPLLCVHISISVCLNDFYVYTFLSLFHITLFRIMFTCTTSFQRFLS